MADEDAPPPYEEAIGNAPPSTVPTKRPVPSAPPPAVFNTGYVPPQGDQGGNPWAYPTTSGYPHGSGGGYGQQQGFQLHGHNSGHPPSPRQGFTSGQQPGYQPQQQCSYPNPNQNQPSGPDRARRANNTNYAIRSNMCLAVCATVCCWPVGLIAIMSECEARDAVQNGDLAHAKEASDKARSMSWISIFVGGCVIGFAVFFGLLVGLTSR
ncbi:uncharacterized protein [Littorina saxatilis]|uniref:uncharacterized protein isoform X2 n=1 Tax=Littorina saxatilis TaxID=31220 RepID=UPI0038B5846E